MANTSTWYRYLEKIQNSPFMDLQNTWWAPTCFKYVLLGWSYIITIPSCRRERVLLENNLRQVLFSINTTMSKIVGSIDLIRVQIFLFSTIECIGSIYCFLFVTSKLVKNRTMENESSISLRGTTVSSVILYLLC